MRSNLEFVKQVLKSKMREFATTTNLRDSIRIHRIADPIDMTQEAAEREMAIENLDRETALARRVRAVIGRHLRVELFPRDCFSKKAGLYYSHAPPRNHRVPVSTVSILGRPVPHHLLMRGIRNCAGCERPRPVCGLHTARRQL